MLIDHNNKVLILNKDVSDFKLDMIQIGGAVMTYHTNNGGRIKLSQRGNGVIIQVIDPTPEAWTEIVNEVKEWCALKNRILMHEKLKNHHKKIEEKAKDRENFLKKLFGKG